MEARGNQRLGVWSMMSVKHRAWLLFAVLLFVGVAVGFAWYRFSSTRYNTFEIRTADPVSGLIAARLD
jgi:hypothetical protein